MLWIFILCDDVRKHKVSCNPNKWTLGRIDLCIFDNVLSTFLKAINKKNLILIKYVFVVSITAGHFMQNFHSLSYLYWNYKLILRLACVFSFLQMTLPLSKFAHPCFRVFEKRTLFPSTAGCCSKTHGTTATSAPSEWAFSHVVELCSAKCAILGVVIFAILMLVRMNPHLVMNWT